MVCRSFCGVAVTAAVLLTSVTAQAADRAFAADGPKAIQTSTDPKSKANIVRPTGAGTFPLIVASHGFAGSGTQQIGWAKHFASWGFVVAVPTFPSPLSPNHAGNADTIRAIVDDLTGPSAATFSVAPGKYGLEGHSAGGLSSTLAAAGSAPSAVVLFDPVDAAGAGATAYANMCAPVLSIFAEAGTCNNQAGWRAFANATKSELLAFDVKSSTHCDGENEPRSLCGPFCLSQGANPTRQAAYAHYATAFFLAKLAGDTAAAVALGTTPMGGDTEIANVLRASATCSGATTDAGAPGADGGSSGSSGPGSDDPSGDDPSSGKSSGSTPASSGAAGESAAASDSSGCQLAGGPSSGAAAALLGVVVAGLLTRRRRP